MSGDGWQLQIAPKTEHVKVHRNKRRMVSYLLLQIGFLGFFSFVFFGELAAGTIAPLKRYELWVAFGAICIMILSLAIRLFDTKPALEFSDEGLLARELSHQIIPWTAILSVAERRYKRSRFLEIEIDRQAAGQIHFRRAHMLLGLANRLLGFRHHVLSTAMLSSDQEFVVQLMKFYMEKSKAGHA